MRSNNVFARITKDMKAEIAIFGYGRFFVRRIVTMFVIELTIVFAGMRGVQMFMAMNRLYAVIPLTHVARAQTIEQPGQCITADSVPALTPKNSPTQTSQTPAPVCY